MANNLYVTAAEERSGKSAIVLGVMQVILKEISRIAFFRPIINDHVFGRVDHDLNLVLKYFKLDIEYNDFNALKGRFDFILCEGTDFRGKDPGFEFDLNANIAANLGAPVLIVASGRDKSTEEICTHTAITIDTLEEKGLDLAGCIINRAPETFLRDTASNAKCREQFGRDFPLYVIPENKALGNPTIDDVKRWLGAEVLYGKPSMLNLVSNYLVAAMQISNFLDYIKEGSLIITPGDRSDIIIASLASRISSAWRVAAPVADEAAARALGARTAVDSGLDRYPGASALCRFPHLRHGAECQRALRPHRTHRHQAHRHGARVVRQVRQCGRVD